jgi:hypothetical protein
MVCILPNIKYHAIVICSVIGALLRELKGLMGNIMWARVLKTNVKWWLFMWLWEGREEYTEETTQTMYVCWTEGSEGW